MKLTSGQIYRIVKLIKCREMGGYNLKTADVYSLCYQVLDDGRYENIKRVQAGYSLEDLKISEKNMILFISESALSQLPASESRVRMPKAL